MMPETKLKTTDISHAVDDLAKHANGKPVQYFMDKYGLDHEEYSWLSYAALPAIAYRGALHNCKWNKARMLTKVEEAIAIGNTAKKKTEALKLIMEKLRKVIEIAEQPMEYVEEDDDVKAG